MKKAVLLPLVLFLAGVAVYVYNGIYHHAWMDNLPNIIIFFFIVVFMFLLGTKVVFFCESCKQIPQNLMYA